MIIFDCIITFLKAFCGFLILVLLFSIINVLIEDSWRKKRWEKEVLKKN